MKKQLLNLTFATALLCSAQAQIPTQGLVVSYDFQNNLNDASASLNHLTKIGGNQTYSMVASTDTAINFDGTGGLVSSAAINNQNFTGTAISFWIKKTSNTAAAVVQGANLGFGINISASTNIISVFFDGSSAGSLNSSGNYKIDDGKWHHVVAQNNGTLSSIYIDGILSNSQNETLYKLSAPNVNAKLYLAQLIGNTSYLNGGLNNFKIYDHALTQCEISSLYYNGAFTSFASYDFNNNVNDKSGNNHLTASNVSFSEYGNKTVASFNGAGSMESTANMNVSDATALTIGVWVKYNNTTTATNKFIVQGANIGFGLYIEANTHKICAFFDGSQATSAKSSASIADGIWHHITAYNNGTATFIYVDGVMQGMAFETLTVGAGNLNEKLYIGKANTNNQFFDGELDDLVIYKSQLSDCAIDEISTIAIPTSNSNNISGLIANYEFDNNDLDASASLNHLQSISGTRSYFLADLDGNKAINFNGNGGLVSTNSINNQNFAGTAISFWIKKSSSAVDAYIVQGAYLGFGVTLSNTTGLIYTFFDGSSAGSLASAGGHSILDSRWHHVVAQNNGTVTSIYIDGVLSSSQNEVMFKLGSPNANAKIYVGQANTNAFYFTGGLNKLSIYNRALTACEINQLYHSESYKTFAEFKFDNNSNDESGNNNHLTNSGVTFPAEGQYSTVAYFDGTSGMVTTNTFNVSNAKQMSISCWVKYSAANSSGVKYIVQGAYAGYGLYIDATTGKICAFFDGSSAGSAKSLLSIADNNWHFVTATNNGISTSLLVDGVVQQVVSDVAYRGTGQATEKLYVGKSNNNADFFIGYVENLSIFNSQLSNCAIDSIISLGDPSSTTVSVQDKTSDKVSIYPNPTENYVNIVADDFQNVQVFSLSGELLVNSSNKLVDLSNLSSGIYFIHIQTKQTSFSQKVCKY